MRRCSWNRVDKSRQEIASGQNLSAIVHAHDNQHKLQWLSAFDLFAVVGGKAHSTRSHSPMHRSHGVGEHLSRTVSTAARLQPNDSYCMLLYKA